MDCATLNFLKAGQVAGFKFKVSLAYSDYQLVATWIIEITSKIIAQGTDYQDDQDLFGRLQNSPSYGLAYL
jgi:hypothetical protein